MRKFSPYSILISFLALVIYVSPANAETWTLRQEKQDLLVTLDQYRTIRAMPEDDEEVRRITNETIADLENRLDTLRRAESGELDAIDQLVKRENLRLKLSKDLNAEAMGLTLTQFNNYLERQNARFSMFLQLKKTI